MTASTAWRRYKKARWKEACLVDRDWLKYARVAFMAGYRAAVRNSLPEITMLIGRLVALRRSHIVRPYRSPDSRIPPYSECNACGGRWDDDEPEWHTRPDCIAAPLGGLKPE